MSAWHQENMRATHIVLRYLKDSDLETLAPFIHVEVLILWKSPRAVCCSVSWGRAGAHHIVLQEPASHTNFDYTPKTWDQGAKLVHTMVSLN
jgi:hypothetical protein